VSPLKIKIPSKNMRKKPTNTSIIHSGVKGLKLQQLGVLLWNSTFINHRSHIQPGY
jgi:hypothetical protein